MLHCASAPILCLAYPTAATLLSTTKGSKRKRTTAGNHALQRIKSFRRKQHIVVLESVHNAESPSRQLTSSYLASRSRATKSLKFHSQLRVCHGQTQPINRPKLSQIRKLPRQVRSTEMTPHCRHETLALSVPTCCRICSIAALGMHPRHVAGHAPSAACIRPKSLSWSSPSRLVT